MNAFLIGGVILVAILVIWLAFETLQGRQKSGAIASQMTELRRDLQTIATSQAQSTGQLETIAKSVAWLSGGSDARTLARGFPSLRAVRDAVPLFQRRSSGCRDQTPRQQIDGHRFEISPGCLSPNQYGGRRSAPGLRDCGKGPCRGN